jgi:hypothetical protein
MRPITLPAFALTALLITGTSETAEAPIRKLPKEGGWPLSSNY